MRIYRHIGKKAGGKQLNNDKLSVGFPVNKVVKSVGFGVMIIEADNHQIVYANPMAIAMSKFSEKEIIGRVCHDVICPNEAGKCPITDFGKKVDNAERVLVQKDGTLLPIIKTVVPVTVKGKNYLIESFIDYSERKRLAEQLTYMSFHDKLTDLFNRDAFEKYIEEYTASTDKTVGIIICDADGLKTINDTLGHDAGDYLLKKIAEFVTCAANEEIAARIGGDEFAVIIKDCNKGKIDSFLNKINTLVTEHNEQNSMEISLSIGYAYNKQGENASIKQLIRTADKNMYKEKLLHRHSAKSAIVSTLTNLLAECDGVTGGHADRLVDLANAMGQHLLLQSSNLANLKLLAQFHDIGKVAVPDAVLGKPAALTDEEREIMRKHCEIGFRIANAANVFSEINDLILMHHEWWNGEGYPLGIKGEEIPLECRIVAILDAYDAMTSDRPYRKAMTKEAAIKELRAGAGTQFDPNLVDMFINMIENIPE